MEQAEPIRWWHYLVGLVGVPVMVAISIALSALPIALGIWLAIWLLRRGF